jgi:hypothetical protein
MAANALHFIVILPIFSTIILTHFFAALNFILTQTVFEPPYSTPVIAAFTVGIISAGYGMMYFGMRHQQYKQGYWK